jgi:hypothetical protein
MTDTTTQANDTAAAAAAPVNDAVTIDNAASRMKMFPLAWPVTYQGKHYEQIGLRRMTAKEVSDFVVRIEAEGRINPDAILRFPIFVDETGAAIPDAMMDGLDADDADVLNTAAIDFLPLRFRASIPEPATAPSNGDTTAAS